MDSVAKLVARSPRTSAEVACVDQENIDISADGDLSLEVHFQPERPSASYRVESRSLMQISAYFRTLLGSENFQEGSAFQKGLKELQKNYDRPSAYPRSELPRVKIDGLDPILVDPWKQQDIFEQLLLILHDQRHVDHRISLGRLANLVIVADRWDCLLAVQAWARHNSIFDRLTVAPKKLHTPKDERRRRFILVGWLLEYPAWISSYTTALILTPSIGDATASATPSPSWMDLPGWIEGWSIVLPKRHCILTRTRRIARSASSHTGND